MTSALGEFSIRTHSAIPASAAGLLPPGDLEVDCWVLSDSAPDATAPLPERGSFLSPSELDRLAAMNDSGRARQFELARLRTKSILSLYLGVPRESIELALNENGKPELADGRLQFNFTHTAGWFALAVSSRRPVGIDLETRREVSHLERIARKFFASGELAMLDATPDAAARESLFFSLWSAKEALIKGLGGGVFKHILETELAYADDGSLQPLRIADANPADWRLHELKVAPGVVGMLAVGQMGSSSGGISLS